MPTNVVQPPEEPAASVEALISDLRASLQETAEEVVPWFLKNMPLMYFQDTDHATQLAHLRAIIAAKASGRPIEVTLRSEDGTEWTSMRPQDHPGVLAELVGELPHDRPLRAAKIHTARDGLVLNTFVFGQPERFSADDPKQAAKLEETIRYAATHDPPFAAEEIREHFARCTAEYILTVTPLRLCEQIALFRQVSGTDGTYVSLERETDPELGRIVVAVGNVTTRRMLERIAKRLAHSNVNIHRAYLDLIDDGDNGTITLLGFVCQAPGGGPIDAKSELWRTLRRDLIHNKWIEHRTHGLAYRNPDLGVPRAEIIISLCDLAHQLLVKQNPYAFSLDRVHRLAEKALPHSTAIADLFVARFEPEAPLANDVFVTRCAELDRQIENDVDLEDARILLRTLVRAVSAVLRTNFFLEGRYGLGFRIDPSFLTTDERPERPFGVFFVHGRGFNGFHVRFRDIARGGLRVVRTHNEEQHALESERLYDEAYNLAFAQQLKNKDIPEGGAKAAVLMDPYARIDRTVKGFVDCLLDMIVPDEAVRSKIVDYFGAEELLYLGPDENITPEFIDWIVARARHAGTRPRPRS